MTWTLILIIGLVYNNFGGPIEKPSAIVVTGIESRAECEKALIALQRQYKKKTAVKGHCVKVSN